MLSVLLSNREEYPEFIDICEKIKEIHELLNDKQFDSIKETVDVAVEICNDIKLQAVKNRNEIIANSTYVICNYLKMLSNYATFWRYLHNGRYKESWGILQNCLDCIICVRRFTEDRSINKLDLWDEHLRMLEKLYPYRVFC